MRVNVDLPEEQIIKLDVICKREGISRAELIRRSIAKLLEAENQRHRDLGFGIWKHKKIDSRKYIDKIRDEWDRKR